MKSFFHALAIWLTFVTLCIVATWCSIRFGPDPDPIPTTTLELSIDGEVKVYKTSAKNTIHVITNGDLQLVDIQVLTPDQQSTTTTPHYKQYGQQSAKSISESSRKSQENP